MGNESAWASVVFGLVSAAVWGVGDFSGGMATRRAPVLTVLLVSQTVGVLWMIGLGIARQEAMPALSDVLWGAAAGLMGMIGLAGFYSAMAIGQVGIAAPVTGLISAIIPVIVGAILDGLPPAHKLFGFALALAGVWLISRPEKAENSRPAGLGLALIGGIGFGLFFVFIARTHANTLFWPLVAARAASITAMVMIVFTRRDFRPPTQKLLPLILLSGTMDVGGNVFFVLAKQAGRLDVASVLSSLYPATTVLLALVILRERLARWQAIGVLLALVAVPLIALEL